MESSLRSRRSAGRTLAALAAAFSFPLASAPGWAFDTGVSDDRVSLPEGPGSLEGVGENVSVDPNMGLMRYSVPVELPAGFTGLTPKLGFNYASGGGSSELGIGWRMPAMTIERMTMRGVPAYDEADRFVSNGGNELVRASETVAPGAPAIYRNRFETDFTRYLWHERRGGRGGYWEAQYKDGRVGFFGANARGELVASALEAGPDGTVFKYHLVEMVDVYGHRMAYTYTKDGAISLVSEIAYVFTNGTPTYRVNFTYAARNDLVSDAKAGFSRILSRRLAGVQVLVRGQQLRRYALSYQDDVAAGRRSRLARVESFGATDERYPIVHSFDYSRGLGAQCDNQDCGQPFLVTMVGEQGLGVSLQSGTANLVDINGDALPDLVDASTNQRNHRFFINQLSSDGTQTFSAAANSVNGQVSDFPIGNPLIQFIDVNGDGFTDLLGGGVDQRVLFNDGSGDWAPVTRIENPEVLQAVDPDLRFMDYDNDMDIDLIRSTATQTSVFENQGDFQFVARNLEPIGLAFSENSQFTDMNGDGLLEVIQLQANQLRFKTNFGRGRFDSAFTTLAHPFGQGEFDLALVEDIDGDGYADIVVVTGNTVRYALNRNGERFEPVQSLSSAGGVSLPNREFDTTVLMADMNGNGSVDVVWVGATGSVNYLDLFPVRSHLLTRIENGIGRVTTIAYQPSVEQRALSEEEGRPWIHPLPHPMTVVAETNEFDLLTNIDDIVQFRYRDGFYDGNERQFRGYAEVERVRPGDTDLETGRTLTRYDVGRVEPHLNGQLLFELRESGGAAVDETTHAFGDESQCPVAEVPTNTRLLALGRRPIGFACKIQTETTIKEGADPSEWITTRTRTTYGDGYGNANRVSEEGVVAVGGGSCEPCTRGDDVFGAACGGQCLGDERFVERSFAAPLTATDGRWILSAVVQERSFGVAGNAQGRFAETTNFYDGDSFGGLAEGQLTQGKLTRQVRRVSDGETIQSLRQGFDVHGNVIETLDPLATAGGQTHRRTYTYDEDGLRVVRVEILNEDLEGNPYKLRRNMQYDQLFDKVVLSSEWIRVEGDTELTAADPSSYTYDTFGRIDSILLPGGDSGVNPSVEIAYDLGNPTTRLITRRRSQVGGDLDIETIECLDGRGRKYQTRRKVKDGEYLVDGFTRFNLRSQPVETFQTYTSNSEQCDLNPPDGVLATRYRYDGVDRRLEVTLPDADVPGGASIERTAYRPLQTLRFDAEDTDPASPHFDTPTLETVDGLGRLVSVERRLADATATTRLEYDGLGYLTGYVDADGNRKVQSYDAIGRVLSVEDPNSGLTTMVYDDASNLVRRTDARGVSMELRYDGINRELERFDASDREGTLIASEYDFSPQCEFTRCPNTAGSLVLRSHPAGIDRLGYDVRRRPISQVRTIEGNTYELRTEYDNADRSVGRVYPDGRRLDYAYDGASRLVAIPGVLSEVAYTSRGQLSAMRRPNGIEDKLAYDTRMRPVALGVDLGGGSLQAIDIIRDRSSNILSAVDGAADTLLPSLEYTHDAWYRATAIARGENRQSLSLDLIDNVRDRGGERLEYGGSRPGAVTQIGTQSLSHDAMGCVLSADGFDNTWDFMGRLTENAGSAGKVLSIYAGDHKRVARHNDGERTHYVAPDFEVRDGVSVIYPRFARSRIARLESTTYAREWLTGSADGEGAVTAGDAHLRQQASATDVDAWLAASARRVLSEGRPAVVALHRDQLGSLVLATGPDGDVLGRAAFGTYGAIEARSGFVDRYGFTGQEHEPDTQLIRFAHRFLSPRTGQWMSPDPAFLTLSVNRTDVLPEAIARYAYVKNNPGSWVDPLGLRTRVRPLAAISKAAGAVKGAAGRVKRAVGRKITQMKRSVAAYRAQRQVQRQARRAARAQRLAARVDRRVQRQARRTLRRLRRTYGDDRVNALALSSTPQGNRVSSLMQSESGLHNIARIQNPQLYADARAQLTRFPRNLF